MFFSSDVSLLTKCNLHGFSISCTYKKKLKEKEKKKIFLFHVLFTKFLDIPKTVIIMQWKGMTVFVKISELISQALSFIFLYSSSNSFFFLRFKFCGKLMALGTWVPCTCYDCHWCWILEGFIHLSFSMLFILIFYYSFSMYWNQIMLLGDFLFHTARL